MYKMFSILLLACQLLCVGCKRLDLISSQKFVDVKGIIELFNSKTCCLHGMGQIDQASLRETLSLAYDEMTKDTIVIKELSETYADNGYNFFHFLFALEDNKLLQKFCQLLFPSPMKIPKEVTIAKTEDESFNLLHIALLNRNLFGATYLLTNMEEEPNSLDEEDINEENPIFTIFHGLLSYANERCPKSGIETSAHKYHEIFMQLLKMGFKINCINDKGLNFVTLLSERAAKSYQSLSHRSLIKGGGKRIFDITQEATRAADAVKLDEEALINLKLLETICLIIQDFILAILSNREHPSNLHLRDLIKQCEQNQSYKDHFMDTIERSDYTVRSVSTGYEALANLSVRYETFTAQRVLRSAPPNSFFTLQRPFIIESLIPWHRDEDEESGVGSESGISLTPPMTRRQVAIRASDSDLVLRRTRLRAALKGTHASISGASEAKQ